MGALKMQDWKMQTCLPCVGLLQAHLSEALAYSLAIVEPTYFHAEHR